MTKEEKARAAAYRDMLNDGLRPEIISVHKHQSMLRPAEVSGSTVNGKVLFNIHY